jgi:5-methylcytosine-specific restriction endonuclease McrA
VGEICKNRQNRKNRCEKCGSKKLLQVHHERYYPGYELWEYDDKDLKVLCDQCHREKHGWCETKSKVIRRPNSIIEAEEKERSEHYLRNDPKGNYAHMYKNRQEEPPNYNI